MLTLEAGSIRGHTATSIILCTQPMDILPFQHALYVIFTHSTGLQFQNDICNTFRTYPWIDQRDDYLDRPFVQIRANQFTHRFDSIQQTRKLLLGICHRPRGHHPLTGGRMRTAGVRIMREFIGRNIVCVLNYTILLFQSTSEIEGEEEMKAIIFFENQRSTYFISSL